MRLECLSEYEMVGEIFKQRFNIIFDKLPDDAFDEQLLGRKFCFAPTDLIYLYFDIEEKLGIKIPEDAVVQGCFTTINNIVNMICNQLQNQSKEAV